jgi:hypothetical protein
MPSNPLTGMDVKSMLMPLHKGFLIAASRKT